MIAHWDAAGIVGMFNNGAHFYGEPHKEIRPGKCAVF